ncbi:SusC/RagA family TonB-linked outer membrane protein [Chitinophagaceae bacterium 26-R-25]|nr:SusC/RagA family TonB-linked outer membrane protein [Chitinophagaceae bacterium 26-R-25]
MKKILLLLTVMIGLITQILAQSHQVSGKVTDEKGNPVSGASIAIKDFKIGTTTKEDGNFSFSIPASAKTLIVSAVGFTEKRITIGGDAINVVLVKDDKKLDEVVVTAMGQKRDKKGLGYSITELKGDALTKTPNQNGVTGLSGKVAGLQVISSGGAPGQAASIVVRGGAKSMTGSNEPLYVIDGVPVSNSTDGDDNLRLGQSNVGSTPNRMSDINPDDVESISVLKGGAASVLYGNRGANGVILITTKSGKAAKGKPIVVFSSNVGADNALKLPEFQNTYAQGTNGADYAEATSFSFGPKIEGQQVYSKAAGKNVTLQVHDPRKDFLKTGFTWNNNISVSQTMEKTNFYFSAGNFKQTAIVPNQDYNKANVRFNITNQLTSKLSMGGNFSYIKTWGNVPYGGQDGNNPFFALFDMPVSWDINGYGYQKPDGSQINFRGGSFDNPLWSVNKNYYKTKDDRIVGGINLDYKALPWLDLSYKLGLDQYHDNRTAFKDIKSGASPYGYLSNDLIKREEITSTFLANVTRKLTSYIGMNFTLGHSYNQRKSDQFTQTATSLSFPGIAHMSNATSFNPDYQYNTLRRTIGVFGDLKLDYKNYLFLGLTARNEWSSTLPASNGSYFYPGVNAAFVFTEVLNIDKNILSYGKIRAAYAKTARDAQPYQIYNVYYSATAQDGMTSGIIFPFGSIPSAAYNPTLKNLNLKPEITKEFELGAELKFLNNRLGLDITYFQNKNTDMIIPLDVSKTTGIQNMVVNGGATRNKGLELTLNAGIIRAQNFNWDMNITFTRIRSKVLSIYGDLDKIYLGGFDGNPAVFAVLGQQYGSIIGTGYQRDSLGRIMVGADGRPDLVDGMNLGKTAPDWTAGITNTFTYKNFSLNVLVDMRHGGYVLNGTKQLLDYYGTGKQSGVGRYESFVFDGVSDVPGKKNDVSVSRDRNWWSYQYNIDEAYVYKNNWVKLREVALSYALPVKNSIVKKVNVGLYGRNLFLWTKVPDVDPESSSFGIGNAQGITRIAYPTTRSMGLNVKVTF